MLNRRRGESWRVRGERLWGDLGNEGRISPRSSNLPRVALCYTDKQHPRPSRNNTSLPDRGLFSHLCFLRFTFSSLSGPINQSIPSISTLGMLDCPACLLGPGSSAATLPGQIGVYSLDQTASSAPACIYSALAGIMRRSRVAVKWAETLKKGLSKRWPVVRWEGRFAIQSNWSFGVDIAALEF